MRAENMNTSEELTEVWQFSNTGASHVDIDHRLRALVELVNTEPRLFASFRSLCEALGPGK